MTEVKKYLLNLYRVLTLITVIIGLLVFTTGKASLTENIDLIVSYFSKGDSEPVKQSISDQEFSNLVAETDNLLTTILKTFIVIIAIIFITFASVVSAVLELIIWIVSFGDNSFYCTRQIWNLCWIKIVSVWYWGPSQNTYLWITFLLYSGFFGKKSVNNNQDDSKLTSGRTRNRK